AAPSPRRKAVGSDQNGGVNPYRPTAAIESATSDNTGAVVREARPSPTAATAAQAATWIFRSPVRSECAAIVTIPIAAIAKGIAVSSPTARSDPRDKVFTICGRKKLKP